MTLSNEKDYIVEVDMLKKEIRRMFGSEVSVEFKLLPSGAEISCHSSTEAFPAFSSWLTNNREGANDATSIEQSQTIEIIGIDTRDYLLANIADKVAAAISSGTLDIFSVQKFGNGFTANSFNYCGSKYVVTARKTFDPASEFYYECLDTDNNVIRVTYDALIGPKDRQIVYCFEKEDVYNEQ